ncbi:MAG: hypothetical protein GF370_05015 [Candidatus Nealsonbacteria bacterium]|nr:hypothetical protein [Candidatus Nealsonbacteria bacterium]
MEKILSEEELDTLRKIKGEVRGLSMKGHAIFILENQGEGGLMKVEEEIRKLGYDFSYSKIKKMQFYPLSLYCVELLTIQRVFKYDNGTFKDIGEFNTKNSLLVRLFMKYFVSLESMAKQASIFWNKYFTVGEMKVPEYDEEKRRVVLRLKGLVATPLFCEVTRGFASGMCQMIVGQKGKCEERKCMHRGDDCHEFLFTW